MTIASDHVLPPLVGAPYVVAVTASTETGTLDLWALLGKDASGKYITIMCDDGAGVPKPFYFLFAKGAADFTVTLSPSAVAGNARCALAPLGYLDEVMLAQYLRVFPTAAGFLRIHVSSSL